MLDPLGCAIIVIVRDGDRQVISDTVGLVNSQLRTLREQLALRLSAGDSFDY
jgi:hypothetical protein